MPKLSLNSATSILKVLFNHIRFHWCKKLVLWPRPDSEQAIAVGTSCNKYQSVGEFQLYNDQYNFEIELGMRKAQDFAT